MIEFD